MAAASSFRITDAVAEAAFAVDDHLHGKGIATLLLERLAAFASASGFTRFQATTMSENRAMIEVFRAPGFEVRSRLSDTTMEVQLSLLPSDRSVAGRPAADVEALQDVVLRVSRLAEAVPEITELDLNPVMALASGKGCRIVDARIKVARPGRPLQHQI